MCRVSIFVASDNRNCVLINFINNNSLQVYQFSVKSYDKILEILFITKILPVFCISQLAGTA